MVVLENISTGASLFMAVGIAVVINIRIFVKIRKQSVSRYFSIISEADAFYAELKGGKNQRCSSYGTIIYRPTNHCIDFGPSIWPPKYFKKTSCPRILLTSTWTNTRFALPGGMAKKNQSESPLGVCMREFKEETGCSSIEFTQDDYLFSFVTDTKLNHYFAKIITNENEFTKALSQFYSDCQRKGYVDETFGTIGFPLWIEGPVDTKLASLWGDNEVWGFPRFLSDPSFRERDQLLVLLMKCGILDIELMKRIFELVNRLDLVKSKESIAKKLIAYINYVVDDPYGRPLPSYDVFMTTSGLKELMLSQ